jgi:predicted nuclease of restriction endonuclease-like (RecB) superfamily
MRPYLKNKAKNDWSVAQVVEHLPSKHEAMNLNQNCQKKKKVKTKTKSKQTTTTKPPERQILPDLYL